MKPKKKSPRKSSRKQPPTPEIDAFEAFTMIAQGAAALGWQMSFKNTGDDDAKVEYVILGTEAEVDRITDLIEAADAATTEPPPKPDEEEE